MKPIQQKSISLETITDYLSNNLLLEARSILSDYQDSIIKITGLIEKIVKRENILRFIVKTTANECEMTVFANFDTDESKEEVKELKIKKGSKVSLSGKFQSAGTEAIVLNDCRLNQQKDTN